MQRRRHKTHRLHTSMTSKKHQDINSSLTRESNNLHSNPIVEMKKKMVELATLTCLHHLYMFTCKQKMDSATDGSNLAVSVNVISNNQDTNKLT